MLLQEELTERKNVRTMLQIIESSKDNNFVQNAEKLLENCGNVFDQYLLEDKQKLIFNHMAMLNKDNMPVIANTQYEIKNQKKAEVEECKQKLEYLYELCFPNRELVSKRASLPDFISIYQASVRQYAIEKEVEPGKYLMKECAAAFQKLDTDKLLKTGCMLEENIER